MHKKIYAHLLLFILIALSGGCASHSSSPTPVIPSTETSIASQTAMQPSLTPTLSPTIAPTYTYTLLPTLSPDNANAKLKALLDNSENCLLPCWLGITPGKSTWQEANAQLVSFSSIAANFRGLPGIYVESGNKWSLGQFTLPYPNDQMAIEFEIAYPTSSTNNDISIVSAISRAYRLQDGKYIGDVYGYSAYNDLLKPYSISRILTNYGIPQSIYVFGALRNDTTISPGFGDYFAIHLWYPNRGIFIYYKMSIEGVGNNYRICPSNAFVSGDFLEPASTTDYKGVLLGTDGIYKDLIPPNSKYVKTTENAFGITEEEFYQRFRSSQNQCLETPKSLWWPN
jgi:hypothetical protein